MSEPKYKVGDVVDVHCYDCPDNKHYHHNPLAGYSVEEYPGPLVVLQKTIKSVGNENYYVSPAAADYPWDWRFQEHVIVGLSRLKHVEPPHLPCKGCDTRPMYPHPANLACGGFLCWSCRQTRAWKFQLINNG